MPELYADTDAWLVLLPIIRAARRHALELYVVTRDFFAVDGSVHLILQEERVNSGAWIAANIAAGDICVTGDPGLAASCIARGARALSPAGRAWSGEGGAESVLGSVANAQALARALDAVINERRVAYAAPPHWPTHGRPRWRAAQG
jgi:uncharacterized protein YaiI (UPF0178 family)